MNYFFVVPGLVPGIHVLLGVAASKKDVDGRDKPGHDGFLDCFAEPVIGPARGRTRWLAMTNYSALSRKYGSTAP